MNANDPTRDRARLRAPRPAKGKAKGPAVAPSPVAEALAGPPTARRRKLTPAALRPMAAAAALKGVDP